MSETPNRKIDTHRSESKTRKPYHTPHMEDYGRVNELTRSGGATYDDGIGSYSSFAPD